MFMDWCSIRGVGEGGNSVIYFLLDHETISKNIYIYIYYSLYYSLYD